MALLNTTNQLKDIAKDPKTPTIGQRLLEVEAQQSKIAELQKWHSRKIDWTFILAVTGFLVLLVTVAAMVISVVWNFKLTVDQYNLNRPSPTPIIIYVSPSPTPISTPKSG